MAADQSLSQLDGGPQPPYDTSIWSTLQNGLDANPDRAALISMHQPAAHLASLVGSSPVQSLCGPDEILTWSYAQMRRGAARLAAALARHNVPPESALLTFIPHGAEWALLMWVSALCRLTLVNRRPEILAQPESGAELRFYYAAMDPSVIVVEDEAAARAVDRIMADAAGSSAGQTTTTPSFLGLCLSPLSEPRPGWVSMHEIAQMAPPLTESGSLVDAAAAADRPDRVAAVLFTSGSASGTPKGVVRTVKNVCASATARHYGSSGPAQRDKPPPSVGVVLGGNWGGMTLSLPYNMWTEGGTVVISGAHFSWTEILHAIETCRVSVVFFMRSHISWLAGHQGFSPERVRSIRRVIFGGEIVTESFLAKARGMFPNAALIPSFGMTEVGRTFGWPAGVPDPLPSLEGIVSCGMPLPGTRARIVGEDGKVVARGERGELHISGDTLVERYLAEEDGAAVFYEDELGRWFRTGDLAVFDKAGCLYVLGRFKDRINSVSGVLDPLAVESCLSTRLLVETHVVGLSSPMHSEVPYAILECFPEGVTESHVKELVVNEIGSTYSLGGALSLEQLGMEGWPMTATGKVSKLDLQRAAFQWVMGQGFSGYAIESI